MELIKDKNYYKKFSLNDEAIDDKVLIYTIIFKLKMPDGLNFNFECKNNNINWKNIKDFIMKNDSDLFSNIIKDCIVNADLSHKNLSNIFFILNNKTHIIIPNNFSKSCPLTGTVVVILKDFLEFLGLIFERKVIAKKAFESTNNCLNYHIFNKEKLDGYVSVLNDIE